MIKIQSFNKIHQLHQLHHKIQNLDHLSSSPNSKNSKNKIPTNPIIQLKLQCSIFPKFKSTSWIHIHTSCAPFPVTVLRCVWHQWLIFNCSLFVLPKFASLHSLVYPNSLLHLLIANPTITTSYIFIHSIIKTTTITTNLQN